VGRPLFRRRNNAVPLFRFTKSLKGNETGVTLIEIVISLAILSLIAVAFLSGLGTASKATSIADERATAESLARSQMEYVKSYPYDSEATTYPYVYTEDENNPNPITLPEGYTISPPEVASIPDTDTDIQKITVTINHITKLVLTVVGYKVNR